MFQRRFSIGVWTEVFGINIIGEAANLLGSCKKKVQSVKSVKRENNWFIGVVELGKPTHKAKKDSARRKEKPSFFLKARFLLHDFLT